MSRQTAWFEVLAHNAEALHSGRTRTFVLQASCTTSSFIYRRWTQEDSAKAKRARDLGKKWGVIIDSVEPSLIVFDGGMLLNNLNSGDTFASFAEQVVKHLTNNAKNAVKRPKIQITKEMRLQTTAEIFCSHPTNKQRLMDIVADPINGSPLTNWSTRRNDSDGDCCD